MNESSQVKFPAQHNARLLQWLSCKDGMAADANFDLNYQLPAYFSEMPIPQGII